MTRLGDLHPTTRRLLLARGVRSLGQGALVVDFALYLHALGWSSGAIGMVLGASSMVGAALSLMVGTSSDRLRRKPFLLLYEAVISLGSLAARASANPLVLGGAAILCGFGRGAGGAAGPFSPAEQAWLAEEVVAERRGQVYSLNAALGFFGMGLGALGASLPAFWSSVLPGAVAYRPLFALVGLTAVGGLFVIAGAAEKYHGSRASENRQARPRETETRQQENQILKKLVLVNSLNGLAVGLTGPLMSYWFALRFHVGPEAIAPVMAVTFVITGVVALMTGELTARIGIVSSVVWERLIGLLLMALLPMMPAYSLAALCYLLRSALSRGSAGAQQALTVGIVREARRGFATSLNAVSTQVPRAAGPVITGMLLDVGQFGLPFFAAAGLQSLYLLYYSRVFRAYEPSQRHTIV